MTNTERFNDGLKNLEKIDCQAGQAVIDSLEGLPQDIGRYIIEFAFGDNPRRYSSSTIRSYQWFAKCWFDTRTNH